MFIPKKNEKVVYFSGSMTRYKIVIVKDIYMNILFNSTGLGYFLIDEWFVISGNIATFIGSNNINGFGLTNGESYVIDSYDIMIEGSVLLEGKYIKPLSEYRVDIIDDILN